MADFTPYDEARRKEVKRQLGFDSSRPLIVVTGGGLGARRLNDAVAHDLGALLTHTNIILISGRSPIR